MLPTVLWLPCLSEFLFLRCLHCHLGDPFKFLGQQSFIVVVNVNACLGFHLHIRMLVLDRAFHNVGFVNGCPEFIRDIHLCHY